LISGIHQDQRVARHRARQSAVILADVATDIRTVRDLGDHLLVLTTSDQRHGDEAMNDGKKTVQCTIKGPIGKW